MKYAVVAALAIVLSVPVSAQVYSRPSAPPIVTAENDAWFRLGEPVIFAGEFYYPAGPRVFFNGDVMVRTGHYNGVPLYADTTLEPYSVVFVPVGRNLMQPYERLRSGELAGTSGSRAPSFPGRSERMPRELIAAAGPPTSFPPPIEVVGIAPETAVGTGGRERTPAGRIDEAEVSVAPSRRGKPFSYSSISVQFMGEKWVMEGPSTPLPRGLTQVAEYKGFPVYAEAGSERERIYLPLAPGRVAPFIPKRD
jgi:hypothetical protein